MTTRALSWTPPNDADVEALPVGRWWDAVRATAAVGNRALEVLGEASGAVIQDDGYGTLYWLIETGSARSWHLRQVRVLTALADETTLLGVPPAHWITGHSTYWRVPLTQDRRLTDAVRLHDALAQAVRDVLGPVPGGRQLCYRCQLPTDEPILVAMEHGGSVGGPPIYACPQHAPSFAQQRDPWTGRAAMNDQRQP
ncbi:hypothetical protein [Streptomyces sp. NPDC019937]|uniref:hypothetical protein n=1 Tax=Streptomyces sp. NPDC019937 TaxID=3154787 RepID=UPI0033DE649C